MSAKAKTRGKSRKEIWEAERRRKQLRDRAIWSLVGIAILAFVGYLIWNEFRPRPGQSVLELSRVHVQPGAPHEAYNTDPPTSGPHYAQPTRAGFYDNALTDETLVHNLEHGYVIIWYNCADLAEAQCQTLKTQIRDVMDRSGPKLIAVPRPNMDALIALTSWGRIHKMTSFNEAEISDFANFFRGRAPEGNAP